MLIQSTTLEGLQREITEAKNKGFIFLYRYFRDGIFYAVLKQRG